MTSFVNGLKSLSGNRAITPEASDFLYDAAEHMGKMEDLAAFLMAFMECLPGAQVVIPADKLALARARLALSSKDSP
jgi:lipopolysaccharide biosynthesis regulator YciM